MPIFKRHNLRLFKEGVPTPNKNNKMNRRHGIGSCSKSWSQRRCMDADLGMCVGRRQVGSRCYTSTGLFRASWNIDAYSRRCSLDSLQDDLRRQKHDFKSLKFYLTISSLVQPIHVYTADRLGEMHCIAYRPMLIITIGATVIIWLDDYDFYQRVSIASYASAGIARGGMSVCLSVCPSVRHTPVLYQNEES